VNKSLGGILLIAGTCIGAGMLALPIASAQAGFFPSIMLLLICWLSMWLTGLYVLEANLPLPEGANFISMSKATLGRPGEIVAWITYLLLLYSLMAAYLSGGGALVVQGMKSVWHTQVSSWVGPLPWIIVVGAIIYTGVKRVDLLNRLLMLGLIITFFILLFFTVPHIKLSQLSTEKFHYIWFALPVAITAFGYHVIVPSLRGYLHSDVKKLKRIILLGSLIPLLTYIVWELVVFGMIPLHGPEGLLGILKDGQPATQLSTALAFSLNNNWIVDGAEYFVFFALASSFLGIAFSLSDFIADGFSIKKTPVGRLLIIIITFIPPFLYATFFPKGFIIAVSYAGLFVAILHGILPALMVWAGRRKYSELKFKAPAGTVGVVLILIFSVVLIAAQI